MITYTTEILHDRIVFFRSLIGSRNQGMHTDLSDYDYVYYVFPTFNDLYENKMISYRFHEDNTDYTIFDIRRLPEIFWKSCITQLEVLYSREIHVNINYKDEFNLLYDNRNSLLNMNLPKLYNTT